MSEAEVSAGVASGRFVAIRREGQEQWRPVAETIFRAAVPEPRFSGLSPKEAQKLIRDAVSSGVLRGGFALWFLVGGLTLLLAVLLGGI